MKLTTTKLGDAFVAWLFNGWIPQLIRPLAQTQGDAASQEEQDKLMRSFQTGMCFVKHAQMDDTPFRPYWETRYSIPVAWIRRMMDPKTWKKLEPTEYSQLTREMMIAPRFMTFDPRLHARVASPAFVELPGAVPPYKWKIEPYRTGDMQADASIDEDDPAILDFSGREKTYRDLYPYYDPHSSRLDLTIQKHVSDPPSLTQLRGLERWTPLEYECLATMTIQELKIRVSAELTPEYVAQHRLSLPDQVENLDNATTIGSLFESERVAHPSDARGRRLMLRLWAGPGEKTVAPAPKTNKRPRTEEEEEKERQKKKQKKDKEVQKKALTKRKGKEKEKVPPPPQA